MAPHPLRLKSASHAPPRPDHESPLKTPATPTGCARPPSRSSPAATSPAANSAASSPTRATPNKLVTDTVEELVAEGILNDTRYVENYVSYHADRGEGPLRIEAELQEFGVPADLIQAALDSGPDWKARARDVRIRRFGADIPETWPQKAKQARFLQYRGFTSDQIRAALGPDFDPDMLGPARSRPPATRHSDSASAGRA